MRCFQRLLIFLLLYNGSQFGSFTVSGHPLTLSSEWTSVRRSLAYPDTVYLSSCSKSCSLFSGIGATHNSTTSCSCDCEKNTPTFLPSAKGCVSRLDECWRQIRFESSDNDSGWIPTFTIPSTDNIFAPSNKILWKEAKVKFSLDGRVNCSISNTFLQTDGLWSQKNKTELFQLQVFNRTTFLQWTGGESDALLLEGSVVQLRLTCSKYGDSAYCLAFRIAGVHVNSNSVYRLAEREWNRIELIVCFLLAILLILTIFGSVILWSVCWRMKKSKLIAKIQTQFAYRLKQHQMYMEEQIGNLKASYAQQAERALERPRPEYQKRKLYFNAEFFEPEIMANPPPVAQQFIIELRKMIDLAKERIRLKRHFPSLEVIMEEDAEEEKYLEIPLPDNNEKTKPEGSSPKSTKSSDSGVDSLSDEENRTQKAAESTDERSSALEKRPASRIPVVLPSKVGTTPRAPPFAQPSRLPTYGAAKAPLSGIMSSPPLPPKPAFLKGAAKIPTEISSSVITEESSDKSSSSSSCASPTRSPPDLEEVLSSVPPPLPDSAPPLLSSRVRERIKNGKRKSYAVFPSDNMLKKSLPRRARRPGQLQSLVQQNSINILPEVNETSA